MPKRAGTAWSPRNVQGLTKRKGPRLGRRGNRRSFSTADGRKVTIRPLRQGDLQAVLRFANSMADEKRVERDLGLISFDRRPSSAEERRFLDGIISGRRRREVVSVAVFDGVKLVGHCDIRRRMADDVMHAGTLGITIRRGYRGVGIGEIIMGEALGEARRIGIWLVQLTVFSKNRPAIGLYRKMGFRRAGIIPNKMMRDGRPLDEMIMYADLRGSDKSPTGSRQVG